ncbi:MAG: CoA transferase [Ignavibacteriales bacterium]|nr:CoA transferase [Ignavibacteriales bacterium]
MIHNLKKFCLIVDKDKILSSEKYNKNADRVKIKDELKPIIEKYILSWKSKNLIKALDKYKIPAAIVLDLKEVLSRNKQTN